MHAGECRYASTFGDACSALGSMCACTQQLAVRAPRCARLCMKELPVQLRRGATSVSGLLIISDGQVWLGGKKAEGNGQKRRKKSQNGVHRASAHAQMMAHVSILSVPLFCRLLALPPSPQHLSFLHVQGHRATLPKTYFPERRAQRGPATHPGRKMSV